MSCLDRNTAVAYLGGDLPPEQAEQWAGHLAECPRCRALAAELSELLDGVREDLARLNDEDDRDDGDPWPPVNVLKQRAARLSGPVIQFARGDAAPRLVAPRSPQGLTRATHSARYLRSAGSVAVTLFVCLVAWWAVSQLSSPRVSAAELLALSTRAETGWAANPAVVIRRTVIVEERRLPEKTVVARQRVEVWQHGARGLRVRRAFDDRNRLLAGEWIDKSGTRTLYRPGAKAIAAAMPAPQRAAQAPAEVWRIELSPVVFASTFDPSAAGVELAGDRYVLTWRPSTERGLVEASLMLSASDLRPIAQAFTFREAGASLREFTFKEQEWRDIASADAPASVFEPDSELVAAMAASPGPIAPVPARPVPTVPADNLELDRRELGAWHVAHRLGLLFGRDVHVRRNGAAVRVVVESDDAVRRQALAARFATLANDPNLRLEFDSAGGGAPPTIPLESTNLAVSIRERLTSTLATAEARGLDDAVRTTVSSIAAQAERLHDRVAALKVFADRWSPDRVALMGEDDVPRWHAMLQSNAMEVSAAAEQLRSLLSAGNTEDPVVESVAKVTTIGAVAPALDRLWSASGSAELLRASALAKPPSAFQLAEWTTALAHVEAAAKAFSAPMYFVR